MAVDLYSASLIAIVIVLTGIVGIKSGVSSAVLEVIMGVLLANFLGVVVEPWLDFLGTFGGLMLTFLAGAEIDLLLLEKYAKQSFTLGFLAFVVPFIGELIFLDIFTNWSFLAKITASLALTATAIAMIYTIFVVHGFLEKETGKLILASVFINDIITLMCVNLISHKFNIYTLIFIMVLIVIALCLPKLLEYIVGKYGKRSIELELRFIFAVMLGVSFLANAGQMQAIFGAFILGLLFANSIHRYGDLLPKLRSITFSLLSPLFFIKAGLLISLPAVIQNTTLILALLGAKILFKFIGTYYHSRKWIPDYPLFAILLFSTGLTVGLVTLSFGSDSGYMNQTQFSIVSITVILSAIIPTLIANWILPVANIETNYSSNR